MGYGMIARLVLLLVGIGIGAGATFYYQRADFMRAQDELVRQHEEQLNKRLTQAGIDLEALQERYNRLRAKSLLDEALVLQYSQELEKLNNELTKLQQELAFYEEMVPAGPDGVVTIRAFEARQEMQHITVRVLLSLSGRGVQQPFEGQLRFLASGLRDGEQVEIVLYPAISVVPQATPELGLRADSEAGLGLRVEQAPESTTEDTPAITEQQLIALSRDLFEVRFDRILRREGVLEVPVGFVPESVMVQVLEGNRVKVSERVMLN